MKRFYRQAGVEVAEGGCRVVLDGKPIRTPAGRVLSLPTRALAEAIAEEWQGQGERVRPSTMPVMQLACTALDRVAEVREAIVAETMKYAETDLICHRAAEPPELVARQKLAWDPFVAWVEGKFGAKLAVVTGIMPAQQSADAVAALAKAVTRLDTWRLTALQALVGPLGSLAIALAVVGGDWPAETAFEVAAVDDLWQREKWGSDAEAERVLAARRVDIVAAGRLTRLVATQSGSC